MYFYLECFVTSFWIELYCRAESSCRQTTVHFKNSIEAIKAMFNCKNSMHCPWTHEEFSGRKILIHAKIESLKASERQFLQKDVQKILRFRQPSLPVQPFLWFYGVLFFAIKLQINLSKIIDPAYSLRKDTKA